MSDISYDPDGNQAESKLKSSIEARREARIKKILENSKSRLDKLGVAPEIKGKYLVCMENIHKHVFFLCREGYLSGSRG